MNKTTSFFFPIFLVAYETTLYLSNDMYLPALPQVAHDLSTAHSLTQLTIAAFCLGMLLMQFILGPIADRYGRRKILSLSGILFLTSTFLCACAPNITILLIARIFQGSAISPLMIAGYAAIHESYEQQSAIHILARMSSVTILAPSFGPLLGGVFLCFANWRWSFIFLFVWAALALWLLYYHMPETLVRTPENQTIHLSQTLKQYGRMLCNKQFLK